MTWTRTLPAGRAHGHPEPLSGGPFSAVELMPGDQSVLVLDQRRLPAHERYEYLTDWHQVEDAIRTMMVRGAPAIGIAAAYGLVLAARQGADALRAAAEGLRSARPTAANLVHAVGHVMGAAESDPSAAHLASVARAYHRADVAACKQMGALLAAELPSDVTMLTHCNAGALATGGYGTALGVVRAARTAGKHVHVIACETRPLLQGGRLTAWELVRDQIAVTVIADGAAAAILGRGEVTAVVVGADRIARNGDVANKVGTYGLACAAKLHEVPFYVVAPWATVDLTCETGAHVPIEERPAEELSTLPGTDTPLVPSGTTILNPAFDVTPARLVTAIYTERGKTLPSAIAS